MPTDWIEPAYVAEQRRKRAEAEVLAKFPGIVVGSSGWYRAVANRKKRGRRAAQRREVG